LLTRDSERYPIYLTFYDPQNAGAPPPRQEAEALAPPTETAAVSGGGEVMAAAFNGNEGTIPRELVNERIMNPMDELRKVRLVPNENGEMTLPRIRSDSILYRLGLKRGDVVKGINDIPIKGGTDLVNVINSMMSSPRFDVSLNRGKEEGRLGYVVQ
jgi:DNA-directed RNA polymerase subunit H (RpoH/RPB5)